MMMEVVSHCQKRPAAGALKGRFEEKKRWKGVIPSRPLIEMSQYADFFNRMKMSSPSSWTMRACEKTTLNTLPKADRATNTESARAAGPPMTLRKKFAETALPLVSSCSRDTPAKYAMLQN